MWEKKKELEALQNPKSRWNFGCDEMEEGFIFVLL
jgi:hypothetical protein